MDNSEEPQAKRQCIKEVPAGFGLTAHSTEEELKPCRAAAVCRGAIVTGAASGIGLATAKVLSDRGCVVLFADRDEEAGKVQAKAAGQLFQHVDVSDETSIKALFVHAQKVLPNLTYLVNVAGCDFIGGLTGYQYAECSSSQFDRAFRVNTKSMFLMCREALPLLKATQGSVVNVSSIQAHRSFMEYTAYAASKGAIISMSRQLAGDFAQFGVRINSVSPGVVRTNIGKNSRRHENQVIELRPEHKTLPPESGKLMQALAPADVGEAIAAMLSMRGVTGQDLIVDGGCSILGVPVWKPFPAPEDFPQVAGIE